MTPEQRFAARFFLPYLIILIIVGFFTFIFLAISFFGGKMDGPAALGVIACIGVLVVMKKHQRRYVEENTASYQRKHAFWDSAYYCSRDDVVFTADHVVKIRPDQFQDYLRSLGSPQTT